MKNDIDNLSSRALAMIVVLAACAGYSESEWFEHQRTIIALRDHAGHWADGVLS